MTIAAGRAAPTTFECIEAIAFREPQRLALVQDHSSWSYGGLYQDLMRATRVLSQLGVKRGDRVAVGTAGFQAGVVLLVAAENLGATTLSFLSQGDPDAQAVFGLVDWVFCDNARLAPQGVRSVVVDAAFQRRIEAVDLSDPLSLPRVAPALDEPQRIARTSGSSGRSKFMLLARQAQEYWVHDVAASCGLLPNSRLLVTGPLSANGTFARASACLRIGAAVLDLERSGLVGHAITHVAAMPGQLEQVLESLPPGYAPPPPVDVCTVGSFVSPSMRMRAARVFGGRVKSRYGTNETGGVSDDLDANGVGVVKAGVDIRIVDEAGSDLPIGRPGVVVVRTPGMADAYIDEPDATKAAFRDGWFHTGDWGVLLAPRMLRLSGRCDDLVNAGGIKIAAAQVEAQVRELVRPTDCAALSVNLDGGQTSLGIALVTVGDAPRDALRSKLAQGLKLGASVGAKVIFLAALPRLAGGKVDRVALLRLFEAPPVGSI